MTKQAYLVQFEPRGQLAAAGISGTTVGWPLLIAAAALRRRGFGTAILHGSAFASLADLRETAGGGDGPILEFAAAPHADAYAVPGWRATVSYRPGLWPDQVSGPTANTLPELLALLDAHWTGDDLELTPYPDTPATVAAVGLSLVADHPQTGPVDRADELIRAELDWFRDGCEPAVRTLPLHGIAAGGAAAAARRLERLAALNQPQARRVGWSSSIDCALAAALGAARFSGLAEAAGIASLTVAVDSADQAREALALSEHCDVRVDAGALGDAELTRLAQELDGSGIQIHTASAARQGHAGSPAAASPVRASYAAFTAARKESADDLRAIGSRLTGWISGRAAGTADPGRKGLVRTVFLESAEHLAAVTDSRTGVTGFDSCVFVPEGGDCDPQRAAALVVPYSGSLSFAGDEIVIGEDYFFQIQDYRAGAFLSVVGLTAIRINDEDDYRAFVADADLARAEGAFPPQLLHPYVTLADRCALGDGSPCGGATARLHIAKSGEVRTAPGGRVLGTAAEGLRTVLARAGAVGGGTAEGGDDVCLADAVPPDLVRAAAGSRPWLSRYLWAIEAVKQCHLRGMTGVAVSGFGARHVPGLPSELVEPPRAPMILWDEQSIVLVTIPHLRAFRLERDAAVLAELILAGGSAERAVELAREHTTVPPAAVAEAVSRLLADFCARGVDLLAVPPRSGEQRC